MMPHGHLDLFDDEPGWLEETRVDLTPVGAEVDVDVDDEPTRVVVVIEAELPGETIICAAPPPPVRMRTQDPDVMYTCGRTYSEHKQIAADAVRRHCEMDVIAPIHDDARGVHLGQATCTGCRSTFTWNLPGHAPRSAR